MPEKLRFMMILKRNTTIQIQANLTLHESTSLFGISTIKRTEKRDRIGYGKTF